MKTIYLTNTEASAFKSYKMAVVKNSGNWELQCSWGRIGNTPSNMVHEFSSETSMLRKLVELYEDKIKKGYVVDSSSDLSLIPSHLRPNFRYELTDYSDLDPYINSSAYYLTQMITKTPLVLTKHNNKVLLSSMKPPPSQELARDEILKAAKKLPENWSICGWVRNDVFYAFDILEHYPSGSSSSTDLPAAGSLPRMLSYLSASDAIKLSYVASDKKKKKELVEALRQANKFGVAVVKSCNTSLEIKLLAI